MQDGTGTQAINSLVEQAAQNKKNPEPGQPAAGGGAGNATPHGGKAGLEKDQPGAGSPTETPEEKAQREAQELQQRIDAQATEKLQATFKELGFESLEEAREFLAEKKKPELTEEEKKKQEALYHTNLSSFAVEKDLMKLEDLNRLNQIKDMKDEDLVFDEFASEVEEEVMEELGDDATENDIAAKIREKFEQEFPVSSANKKVSERAEKKLKAAAQRIREPLESSFKRAKTEYDERVSVRNEYPKYEKSMQGILNSVVPSKIAFYSGKDGDEDVNVELDVPEDVKKEILASVTETVVKNHETFALHKQGKLDDIKAVINDHVEYQLWKRLSAEGKRVLAERFAKAGESRGRKSGSNVGSQNSFAVNPAGGKTNEEGKPNAKQEVLDSTAKKK